MIQQVNGAKLYVERHGAGEPLICLHSFSSNGRLRFGLLLPELERDFTCYVVDLRGHGRSTNEDGNWSHERIAHDIIELCEGLGLTSAFFLAASSGAMAMLRVAQYKPELVRAMVLDSATYQVPEASRQHYKHPDTLSPKLKAMYAEANEVYGPEYGSVLAKVLYDFRLAECDINIPLEGLSAINAPTLLIAGENDQFFPPYVHQAMAQSIPGSELVIFSDTGHIVMEFYPKRVAELAVEFFRRYQ